VGLIQVSLRSFSTSNPTERVFFIVGITGVLPTLRILAPIGVIPCILTLKPRLDGLRDEHEMGIFVKKRVSGGRQYTLSSRLNWGKNVLYCDGAILLNICETFFHFNQPDGCFYSTRASY
jgi:hypothetical protein